LVAVQHLRTLLSVILTNSEVRKLLSDFSTIGADLLSKGAIYIAHKISPTEEQLCNVYQPAPDNEFNTAGGRLAAPGETPVRLYRSFLYLAQARPQQHPDEDQGRIVDANGTDRGVQEATQQAQAGHKAQDYAHSDSPQETEEKKMGMREKMRQMGVSVIHPISRIYLPWHLKNNVRVC
jgi:hypothetical protein